MTIPLETSTRLPDLRRQITLVDMIAYGGATWDWHRLHYDRDYLAEKQIPAPVVDGQMLGAFLAQQATAAFDPPARPVRMSFRFSAMVFAGAEVTVTGEIGEIDDDEGGRLVTVAQKVTTDDGTVAIENATTVVRVPS